VWLGTTAEKVCVKFEVLTSVLMKIQVDWSVMPCWLVNCWQRFKGMTLICNIYRATQH